MREKYYFIRDKNDVRWGELGDITQIVNIFGKLFLVVLVFLSRHARINLFFLSPSV